MKLVFAIIVLSFFGCQAQTESADKTAKETKIEKSITTAPKQFDTSTNTIHVFVALCDNQYQGIVPVSKNLGNGQRPNTNLYWGSAYGIKTFFKKSSNWNLVESRKIGSTILERLIFRHKKSKHYLVADAYDGKYIKQTTTDFLRSSCGMIKDTLQIKNKTIGIGGNAKLNAYIGHDGLMDFELEEEFKNTDKQMRDVIILACYSKHFFAPHLQNAHVNPLVWTTGLMAPEAYTLHDALDAYIKKEGNEVARTKAAKAYAKYQRCGINAAKRLLVSGW